MSTYFANIFLVPPIAFANVDSYSGRMTPDQLLTFFEVRTQTALAHRLGKPKSTVADWFQRGIVPRTVQLELQIQTGGRLMAKPR